MSDAAQRSPSPPHTLTALVDILDTLVNDFDVTDVLTQLTSDCVDLLHINAAGILLADTSGQLRIVGASSEQIQLLELFQLQNEQGPCLDCYSTGETVAGPDLTAPTPWPNFAARSVAAGYLSVYAIPLRRNGVTLGCLNLFMSIAEPLAPGDIAVAQALADVASIAIVQSHANQRTDERDGHLHDALNSRVTIEQAKGMIAEQFALALPDAFELLRSYARDSGHSLTGTAKQLVAGTITIDALHRPAAVQPESYQLTVDTSIDQRRRIVRIGGELDLATRAACFNACVNGEGDTVEIDISTITFMDCSGYGALIAARHVLEQRGGSLSVTHPANQPAQLLDLLAESDTESPPSSRSLTHDVPNATRHGPHEEPPPFKTAVARSLRKGLARLGRLPSSRHTVAKLSRNPQKTERRMVMQVQPTQVSTHTEPAEDRQANGQPRDLGN